ncbi:hypothetical protein GCM10020358_67180 [Amorphoplanes nipponensis]
MTADRPADAWSWLRWNRRRYDDVPGTVARTAEPVPAARPPDERPPAASPQTIGPRTRRIVYGAPGPAEIRDELGQISTVDLAHVVMLAEQKLLPGDVAARAAGAHHGAARVRLRRAGRGARPAAPAGSTSPTRTCCARRARAPRSAASCTPAVAHDLKATTRPCGCASRWGDLAAELLRLQAVLLNRARAHRTR